VAAQRKMAPAAEAAQHTWSADLGFLVFCGLLPNGAIGFSYSETERPDRPKREDEMLVGVPK
jgi:hypothetical protein